MRLDRDGGKVEIIQRAGINDEVKMQVGKLVQNAEKEERFVALKLNSS